MNKNLRNILTISILFLIPTLNFGQSILTPIPPSPIAPDLKTASSFALFTAAGAFNNTGASTKVTGNVGNNTGAFNAFPPGTLMGLKIRGSQAAEAVQAAQAAMDVASAYAEITLKNTCDVAHTISTILGSRMPPIQVLTPNYYCLGAASLLDGELILDGGGDPNAVFIFRIGGAFASTVDSKITLLNGASPCNVYWQINGAVALRERTIFQGTILANGAIELFDNVNLLGRGLSTAGAISTADNVVVTSGMPPTASIITAATTTTFCAGGSVVLSGNMGGTWSNGAVGTDPITVTTSGDYFVTNTNGCQSVTSNHIMVIVNPLPDATIISNVTICSGAMVTLRVGVDDPTHTYTWTASAGAVPIGANPVVTPPAGMTTYTLTETINATRCSKKNSVTITEGVAPTCTIIGNDICGTGTTQLCVVASTPSTYVWTGPSGSIVGSSTTECITVNALGLYSVAVNTGCGTSNCNKTVMSLPLPVATVISPVTICSGTNVALGAGTVTDPTHTYLWTSVPASVLPMTANPMVKPTVNTTYTLIETITATGCQSTNSVTITVSSAPVCSITGIDNVCPTVKTTLTAQPASTIANPLTYLWNTTATTPSITVGEGAYSVIVTNASGCFDLCSKVVSLNPLPVANAGSDVTICNGFGVTLGAAQVGTNTYSWISTPSGLVFSAMAQPFVSPSVTTTYTLTETTAAGCQKTNSVTVTVSTLFITGGNVLCPGKTTQLCAPLGFASYLWDTGETSTCITATPSVSKTYTVTVGGCGATATYNVRVIQPNTCDCQCR